MKTQFSLIEHGLLTLKHIIIPLLEYDTFNQIFLIRIYMHTNHFIFAVETEQPPLPNLFPSGDINLLVYETLTLVCNVSVPKDTHIRFKFSYRTQEEEVRERQKNWSRLFEINNIVH